MAAPRFTVSFVCNSRIRRHAHKRRCGSRPPLDPKGLTKAQVDVIAHYHCVAILVCKGSMSMSVSAAAAAKSKRLSLDARPHPGTSGQLGAPAGRQSRERGGPLELPQASPKRWESPLHTHALGIQRAPRAHSPSIPRTFAYYSLNSWSRRRYTRSQSRDDSRTTRPWCHTLQCCTHAVTSALAQNRRKEVVEHCCDCYIIAGWLRRRTPRHPWMGLPVVAAIDPRPQSRYKAGQCDRKCHENAQSK